MTGTDPAAESTSDKSARGVPEENHAAVNQRPWTLSVPSDAQAEKASQATSDDDIATPNPELEKAPTELNEDQEDLSRVDTSDYPKSFKPVALDMTIVATAIPRITDEFHSLNQVGWYGSAFFLTVGAFQSTWGKAYKYFPLKTAFLIAISIFELGSLLCGVAQNSITLIIGRAIAGTDP